jgi:hypothetical protein
MVLAVDKLQSLPLQGFYVLENHIAGNNSLYCNSFVFMMIQSIPKGNIEGAE